MSDFDLKRKKKSTKVELNILLYLIDIRVSVIS